MDRLVQNIKDKKSKNNNSFEEKSKFRDTIGLFSSKKQFPNHNNSNGNHIRFK